MHQSIAVVVTAFNQGQWIGSALASVAAQILRPTEIVVVDVGSTDNSVAIAEDFAARWPELAIRVIRVTNSGHPAQARNAGIFTVSSEIIICLDAADVISPLYLHAVAVMYSGDPGLGLVWPDVIAFDRAEQRQCPGQSWDATRQAQVNLLPGITAFRRSLWERIGGYRTNMRGYEDWDFWVACAAAGARGARIPFPHFYQRDLGSGVDASTAPDDLRLRATIVSNNPSQYCTASHALADAILGGKAFDAVAALGAADEILGTGLAQMATSWAREAVQWARQCVAAGNSFREREALAELGVDGTLDAEGTTRLGALFLATGDTETGLSLLVLAWSTASGGRGADAPAAPSVGAEGSTSAPGIDVVAVSAVGKAAEVATRSAVIAAPLEPGISTPRVLTWMPYGQWMLHALQEMTILHGARWRGAEVRYVLCDGAFRECDMHWVSTAPRQAASCATCLRAQHTQADGLRMPHEWLGDHLTNGERDLATQWAAEMSRDVLLEARWKDWAIGEWIVSSVHSHFRVNRIDPTQPAVESVLRAYLEAGLLVAFAMDRLLTTWRPDVMLLFNGRLGSLRVAFELARAAGVRVVTHERGWLQETLYLAENADCLSISPIRDAWRAWSDVPLTGSESQATDQWLADRAHGRRLNWLALTGPPEAHTAVRETLGLRVGAPLMVVFTSSEDEYVACADYSSPFGTQERWLEETVAWASVRPEVDVVVRVHPNTTGSRATGSNATQFAALRDLAARAPTTVRFVWPDDETSSYSLMDMAPVSISYVSTVALEHACFGGAAVTAATSTLTGHGFTEDVRDPAEYRDLLDALTSEEAGSRRAHERTRLARRFAYFAVFRYMLPFPLVQQPGPLASHLAYTSLEALRPGCDAGVDAAVSILLDGRAVCLPPSDRETDLDGEASFCDRPPIAALETVA